MARTCLQWMFVLATFSLFGLLNAQTSLQSLIDQLPSCAVNKCGFDDLILKTCAPNPAACGCTGNINDVTGQDGQDVVDKTLCVTNECSINAAASAGLLVSTQICEYLNSHNNGSSGHGNDSDEDGSSGGDSGSGDDNSSGLSTGAKAGIGVGIAVVVIAIIIAVAVIFIVSRNRKRAGPTYNQTPRTNMPQMQQLPYADPNGTAQRQQFQPMGQGQVLPAQGYMYPPSGQGYSTESTQQISRPSSQGALINRPQHTPSPVQPQLYQPPVSNTTNMPQQQVYMPPGFNQTGNSQPQMYQPSAPAIPMNQQQFYQQPMMNLPPANMQQSPQLPPEQDPRVAPYHDPEMGNTPPPKAQANFGTNEAQSNQLVGASRAPTQQPPPTQVAAQSGQGQGAPGNRYSSADLYD